MWMGEGRAEWCVDGKGKGCVVCGWEREDSVNAFHVNAIVCCVYYEQCIICMVQCSGMNRCLSLFCRYEQ